MSDTRWTRVDAIFAGALALPESERAAFLDRACGDDAALRAEVTELLEAADASDGWLDDAISAELLRDVGLVDDPALPEGTRIGPFRVVRLLGEGGMGAVHLAERADGQFEQRVAIKLVHPGWVRGGRLVQRFLRERQILAGRGRSR